MFGWSDLVTALPEIIVLSMACLVLLVGLVLKPEKDGLLVSLTMLTLVFAALVTLRDHLGAEAFVAREAFNGAFVRDTFGDVLKLFMYMVMAAVVVFAKQYLRNRSLFKGEYFSLALFALVGMMVMVSGNNLVTLYLGLELLALSSYALVAFDRNHLKATEAAVKYFVLGALASGMLLYGLSMVYGAAGSLQLQNIAQAAATQPDARLLILGLVFVLVGVAFKLGAAPFHMWVPDVYTGAPTATTALIASAPKLAAFGLAVRLLGEGLGPLQIHWQSMVAILAVLSIVIGNLFAIQQTNIKRLFAYSTISHIGFMLLGFVGGADGFAAAMFYIITYALMAAGGFGLLIVLSGKGVEVENIEDLKGLNQRNGWLAFLMLLIIASMAGFPPLVGFVSKLWVLKAALDAGYLGLTIIAVIFAVIGAFYYLRVIKVMYFDDAQTDEAIVASVDARFFLNVLAIAQLALVLLTPMLLDVCSSAIAAL